MGPVEHLTVWDLPLPGKNYSFINNQISILSFKTLTCLLSLGSLGALSEALGLDPLSGFVLGLPVLDSVVGNIVLFWLIDVSSLVTSAEMSILDKSPNLSTMSFELISGGDKKELKKVVNAKQILLQFPNKLTHSFAFYRNNLYKEKMLF